MVNTPHVGRLCGHLLKCAAKDRAVATLSLLSCAESGVAHDTDVSLVGVWRGAKCSDVSSVEGRLMTQRV